MKKDDVFDLYIKRSIKNAFLIKNHRMRMNLTQKELGRISGITQSKISELERNEIPLTRKMAENLAHALQMVIGMLVPAE